MSAPQKGRDFLVGIRLPGSPETVTLIRSCRTTEFTGARGTVEVSQKDTHGQRKTLPGAEIMGYDLSMDGVYRNQPAHQAIAQAFHDGTVVTLVICDAVASSPETPAGNLWEGEFEVNSFARSGNHNGEQTYAYSFANSDFVEYTPAT